MSVKDRETRLKNDNGTLKKKLLDSNEPIFKQSISDIIRREVKKLIMAPAFKNEMAQELLFVDPYLNQYSNCEYVKLDDVKEIVKKLIFHDDPNQTLLTQEDKNKCFKERTQPMEEQLVELKERIDQLTLDLHSIIKRKNLKRVCPMKTSLAKPKNRLTNRLKGGFDIVKALKRYQTLKIHYNKDLKCVYSPQDIHFLSNVSVIPKPPSLPIKRTSLKPRDWTHIQSRSVRLIAERQMYRTNMLMYKKSDFSLGINNRKQNNWGAHAFNEETPQSNSIGYILTPSDPCFLNSILAIPPLQNEH